MNGKWHQVQDADHPASYKLLGNKPATLKFKENVHHEGKVILGAVEPDKKRIHAEHALTECYILVKGAEIFHASNTARNVLVEKHILPREAPADGWEQVGTASKLASVGHAYFTIDSGTASILKRMFDAKHLHIFKTKKEIHCYPDPEIPKGLRTDIPIEVQ
ncbi:MAG: hypothetical protein WBC22_02290 [Sedimentisphaerales bacterium]